MSRPDRIRAHALRRRNFQPQVSPVSHTTTGPTYLPPLLCPPHPSLSSATLYHANRCSPPLAPPPPPSPPLPPSSPTSSTLLLPPYHLSLPLVPEI